MQSRDTTTALVFLVSGMALFGSATPVSKLVGEDLPVFTASLLRVLLGALALAPFVAADLRDNVAKISRRDWLYLGLIALFGMVGFTLFLITGMRFISGVAGSVVMSFTPALTAAAAALFLGSPLGWRKGVAIALGVAGLVILHLFKDHFGNTGSGAFYIGVGLVFAAICCEAAYTLIGKKVTDDLPPLTTSFLACVLSLPLFLVLAVFDVALLDVAQAPASAWIALLWWGIGTLGAGSALWYSGLARAEGTTAAGFMAVMPLSALLFSYLVLGDEFHPVQLAGIVLVLGSVGVMSWVHMSERA
ncbi:MAG: DMT family transporter [Pseudolabrys sp.]